MKKLKQALSFIVTLMFLVTLVPRLNTVVKAENLNTDKLYADTMAVLVGDFAADQGLGNNWDTGNTKLIMKEFAKGNYWLTVNFTKAGSYNYKVAFDKQWDNPVALGNNGQNKSLNVTAAGPVSFRVDAVNGQVYDSINDCSLSDAVTKMKSTATLTGSLPNATWKQDFAENDLNYIGDGYFSKEFTLPAGSYEYKVAYDHRWSNGEVGSNVNFTLTSQQTVTFLANPYLGLCTDSVNDPAILKSVSFIGTAREAGDSNWDQTAHGYEFSPLTGDGKYVYSKFLPQGTYEYKAVVDYKWDVSLPSSGNASVTVPEGGKYVVFIADMKNNVIYDSVNKPSDVASVIGIKSRDIQIQSPVINADGTVTFNYKNASAGAVYLAGSMTNWADGKIAMTKDVDGIWSTRLRLGDAAATYEYKFIVDGNWITDPVNAATSNGNSKLVFPQYNGRKVVLAGTIQSVVGAGAWDPASDVTKLTYAGNGMYNITIPQVPAGMYEYKVAMGSWTENYGANAAKDGANIKVTVPTKQDVKFVYSDDSHVIVDSINYKFVQPVLHGTGIADTVLKDERLTGVYSAKVTLTKGTYSDLKITIDGNNVSVNPLTVTADSKVVTFSYDPVTGIAFNDGSSKTINTAALYFDSRNAAYKSPYGAVPTGSEVTFNLKAAKDDITQANLILLTPNGTKVIAMSKNGTFDANSDKWTAKYTFNSISQNKFYFVVTNGSSVKAYGDDDGYFGPGKADDLGKIGQYDLNVYDKNFKTPDWLKNAVIYQIFPDRFFDGDTSNDRAQTTSRGDVNYEFPNWSDIPEDPDLEYKTVDGQKVPQDGYTGYKGDGNWSNEMYGGDLVGVQKKLDYLQGLGITVLYFNPISQSISSHRYDTTDYTNVDPLLGRLDDFVNLAKEAHKRGMHIILDGVFNHVSDDSIYFDRYGKYMEAGKPLGAYQYWAKVYNLMKADGSTQAAAVTKAEDYFKSKGITDFHYKEWFIVKNNMITKDKDGNPVPAHYEYEGWWGYDSMPVVQALNDSEYNVKTWADEIIDGPNANSRLWLREGSNGWRLDVANEVSDETWRHFRTAVKEEGDNAIIGEIWTDASKYILGDMYDSVMNYRFRDAVMGFVKGSGTTGSAVDSMNALEAMREQYPKEAFEAMMNLVDSHDTQRVISDIDGYQKSVKAIAKDPTAEAFAKMRMVPLIQMTYPGAPTIYYGDELGQPGADDPDNRRTINWNMLNSQQNKALHDWYSLLSSVRNANPVLRTGDIASISLDSANKDDIMAYSRSLGSMHALVAVNRKAAAVNGLVLSAGNIADGTVLVNALNTAQKYTVVGGKVTVNVPAQSGVILMDKLVGNANTSNNKDDIKKAIESNTNQTIVVYANDNPVIDKDVFEALKGTDKTITFVVGDVTWTFNGKDINAAMGLDLSLKTPSQELKDKINAKVKELSGKSQNVFVFSFKHDGPLPGKAKIRIFLGMEWANKTVTLRRYLSDKNIVETVLGQDKVTVDSKGFAEFVLDHCSDYFVTEVKLPQTGGIPMNDYIVFGAVISLVGVFLFSSKKNTIKKA